jgi:hypothetical protein
LAGYASSTNSTECTPCGPGTFSNSDGSNACALCPAGSYCVPLSTNPVVCDSGK